MKMRGTLEWSIDNIRSVLDDSIGVPAPDGGSALSAADLLRQFYRPDTTAKGELVIPARLSLGYFHRLNEKIDLLFDYTFIQTSDVKEVRVQFLDKSTERSDRVSQGDGGIQTNWRDSFKTSLGMNYHYNDKLTLRTGFQYDLTPVPSARFRHPGAPDSDRYMYSLGANYKVRNNLSLDFAYSLILLDDSFSNYRDPCRGVVKEDETGAIKEPNESCTGNGGTFMGRFFDTSINMLSFGFNQKF